MKFVISAVCIFYSFYVSAQTVSYARSWSYSGGYYDGIVDLCMNSDDSVYILARLNNTFENRFLFLDSAGQLRWSLKDSMAGSLRAESLLPVSSHELIICGYRIKYSKGYISLFKVNSAGTVLWSKLIKFNNYMEYHSIQKTSDNGLVISGVTDTTIGVSYLYNFVMKTDSSGNVLWAKMLMNLSGSSSRVIETDDGGIIFFTASSDLEVIAKLNNSGDVIRADSLETNINGSDVTDLQKVNANLYLALFDSNRIIAVDSTGDLVWTRIFNRTVSSLSRINDTSLIICGAMLSIHWHPYTEVINSYGSSLDLREYSDFPYDRSADKVHYSEGSHLYLAGSVHYGAWMGNKPALVKTDTSRNLNCMYLDVLYNSIDSFYITNAYPFSIIASSLTSTNVNDTIILVPELPSVNVDCNEISSNTSMGSIKPFSVFPNPATNSFTIQSSVYNIQGLSIENLFGKVIFRSSSLPEKAIINCEYFLPGMYFLNIECEIGITTQKIMVQ